MEPFLSLQVLDQSVFDVPRCFHPNILIEFSLDIYVTKTTLDDFGRRSNIISAHIESYQVYKNGHKVGHCHQLHLLLVHLI